MSDPTRCSECRALLEELRTAGMLVSPLGSDELRGIRKMLGSEEGVEELLTKFPFRPQIEPLALPVIRYPGFHNLFRKILDHKTRTGHNPTHLFHR
jgi:hypothetical protein